MTNMLDQLEAPAVTPENYDPLKELIERIEGMQVIHRMISKRVVVAQQELDHAKTEHKAMKKMEADMVMLIERAQAELIKLRDREEARHGQEE